MLCTKTGIKNAAICPIRFRKPCTLLPFVSSLYVLRRYVMSAGNAFNVSPMTEKKSFTGTPIFSRGLRMLSRERISWSTESTVVKSFAPNIIEKTLKVLMPASCTPSSVTDRKPWLKTILPAWKKRLPAKVKRRRVSIGKSPLFNFPRGSTNREESNTAAATRTWARISRTKKRLKTRKR